LFPLFPFLPSTPAYQVQSNAHTNKTPLKPALFLAITAILIRCSFRVAELSEGFKGKLANDEVLFMIFEGVMMAICVCVLTVAHPGLTLGARWNTGAFHWSQRRNRELEKQHHGHQPTPIAGAEAESSELSSGGSSEHDGTNKETSVVREAGGVV
jgi:hypothetical protein